MLGAENAKYYNTRHVASFYQGAILPLNLGKNNIVLKNNFPIIIYFFLKKKRRDSSFKIQIFI